MRIISRQLRNLQRRALQGTGVELKGGWDPGVHPGFLLSCWGELPRENFLPRHLLETLTY